MTMIFLLLGGLGMFLYGMSMMSEGLENVAGDRMRRILEVLTSNRFAAVGIGAAVTAVIQSSSATTVMVVGFVNAGLMNLLQATGVIMGANIGTTITGQLIAFKLSDIAPFILFIGMLMTIFSKKRKVSKIGEIVLGFGLLFVGITLMSQAMDPLKENEQFRSFLVNFKNPVVGILVGTIFTAVIQSSSASVGILQTLAVLGLIGLDNAVYVILGQNIGTCITAILAAIGTSANSKRTAGIHLMFNILGTTIYMILLGIFPGLVPIIESLSPGDAARQIANFHTLFNLSVTIMLFPFASLMVKLITRIIPEKQSADAVERKLLYLDERIAQTPAIALSQTLKEINRMGKLARDSLQLSIEALFEQNEQKAEKVLEFEKTIDYLTQHITTYLIDFSGMDLSKNDLKVMGSLHHVIIDLERIGDHAENIAGYAVTLHETKDDLSPEGHDELRAMVEKTMEILDKSLEIFKSRDKSKLQNITDLEQEIDNMKKDYIKNHIDRLQVKACNPQVGVIFTNTVAALERVSDHADNIAFSINIE
ncbi:MAG TPA: sodium-dependent phosphate transporter [Ruminiclostridium sp.]|nr:sodium-dependent phosphate transporter [Ruminiclostridium sp.]